MEYPLHLIKPASKTEGPGFAVANDEDEHKKLSDQGFEPKYEDTAKRKPADAPAKTSDKKD